MYESDWRYPAVIKLRGILSKLTGLSEEEIEKTFKEPPEWMNK